MFDRTPRPRVFRDVAVGDGACGPPPRRARFSGTPRRSRRPERLALALALAVATSDLRASAEGAPPVETDFFDLSIEELVQMQVTSVAGVEQDWFETPSAITVITGEQLSRSGFTTIADALRTVPGMHVGRVDTRQWAVTARGFSGLFSNGLQVLIDGRVVYNQLFGGVFWDVQDLVFEDIDRIEVIRGPGATLWGANAVNGVVNVITKSARETHGTYVAGGAGDRERGFVEARQGGRLDDRTHYRVWGRYSNRDETTREIDGIHRTDDTDLGVAGLQIERDVGEAGTLTLQGQGHSTNHLGQSLPGAIEGNTESDGGHLLLRYRRVPAAGSMLLIQAFYDVEDRRGVNGFDDRRDTFDLSLRHEVQVGERNDLLWGVGYRHRRQNTESSGLISIDPENRNLDFVTAFVQDTLTIVDDRLFMMVGSKLGHNDFTGFEIQPGARLWWTPTPRTTLWAAVSRAVRTPTIVEEDITAVIGPGETLVGEGSLDAETLVAYEVGGRTRITEQWIVDVAAFYNQHDDLIRQSPSGPGLNSFDNVGSAEGYGFEVASVWQVVERLRIDVGYTFYELDPGSRLTRTSERGTPRHQVQTRAQLEVTKSIGLDLASYYVSQVRDPNIDAYVRLDVGVHWTPKDWVELAVFGQNLLGDHEEYFNAARVDSQPEIRRGFYGRAKLRF